MAEVLALPRLFDAVVARFAAEGTAAANVFGWREPAQHATSGPRCAWIPGDPTGAIGKIGPARNPGRIPRSLATLFELFTVEIYSFDSSALENERAQYTAVRLLRDAWHRAVYLAAHGTFAIEYEAWLTDKKERRHGAALRVVCSIESAILDVATDQTLAPADTHAAVAVAELDVTEVVDTALVDP